MTYIVSGGSLNSTRSWGQGLAENLGVSPAARFIAILAQICHLFISVIVTEMQ